jgi:hypothetical protein
MLTQANIKEYLDYDPLTGLFTWIASTNKKVVVGKTAGRIINKGYSQIGILGEEILAHRLAWLYMTGDWPSLYIDHINGIKSDNRWVNLRDVSNSINLINRTTKVIPASGLRGVKEVRRVKSPNKYIAKSVENGITKHIGTFDDKYDAALAYQVHIFKTYGDYLPEFKGIDYV